MDMDRAAIRQRIGILKDRIIEKNKKYYELLEKGFTSDANSLKLEVNEMVQEKTELERELENRK